jgi:hypothetical protein
VAATAIWENRNRPPAEIYYEVPISLKDSVTCNPNAFLTACTIPAMVFGEKRLAIDEPVCPTLVEGLNANMRCLQSWYGDLCRPIPIQAPLQSEPQLVASTPRAGGFFSCGVDALAMFRTNRLHFPLTHPRAFQDAVLIYGILNGEDEYNSSFQNVIDVAKILTDEIDVSLLTVSTNAYAHIRDLDPDFSFWQKIFQGSFLAAVGHIFSVRLSSISIGSSDDYSCVQPYGSHLMLDPKFSSYGLQVRYENPDLTRMEKTQIVSEWELGIKHLRVCNFRETYREGNRNCGKCEKCMSTMAALLSIGALQKTTTFPTHDITAQELIRYSSPLDPQEMAYYRDAAVGFAQTGRTDLVKAVRRIEARYEERDLAGCIKRFDRFVLGGRLLQLARRRKRNEREVIIEKSPTPSLKASIP